VSNEPRPSKLTGSGAAPDVGVAIAAAVGGVFGGAADAGITNSVNDWGHADLRSPVREIRCQLDRPAFAIV
jgi:hypothetical protein